MTQRRRNRHRKRRVGRRAFLIGLGGSVSAALTYYLLRSIPAGNNAEPAPSPQAAPNPALPSGEWRAVWVSYLEFAEMDFSSESAFRADAAALMDNCLSLGLNTVIAQVRPFGDALYRSSLFPWSHLCTGVQGQDPGFDPLDVLLTEAHARGLSLEAWVNPYRLRSSASMPPVLAESSLLNAHPECQRPLYECLSFLSAPLHKFTCGQNQLFHIVNDLIRIQHFYCKRLFAKIHQVTQIHRAILLLCNFEQPLCTVVATSRYIEYFLRLKLYQNQCLYATR